MPSGYAYSLNKLPSTTLGDFNTNTMLYLDDDSAQV